MVLEAPRFHNSAQIVRMSEKKRDMVAEIFPSCERVVVQICQSITRNNEGDTAEAVGQTWVNVCGAMEDYKDRDLPLSHFVSKVARNTALNELRYNRRHPTVSSNLCPQVEETIAQNISPEEWTLQSEKATAVNEASASLNPDYLEVLSLRFGRGLSYSEIGKIMGHRSEVAIKTLAHRALAKMRNHPKILALKSEQV